MSLRGRAFALRGACFASAGSIVACGTGEPSIVARPGAIVHEGMTRATEPDARGFTAAPRPPVALVIRPLPTRIGRDHCTQTVVAFASGEGTATGSRFVAGDLLSMRRSGSTVIDGRGVVVIAEEPLASVKCLGEASQTEIVRSGAKPVLVWSRGSMRAWPGIGEAGTQGFYMGRLTGTAPVAEHEHAASWELLAVIHGSGTLRLEGRPVRITAGMVAVVPPGSKHAWQPDPDVMLDAVQVYAPPGPEKRFVALAAADANASDAGTLPGAP